MRPSVLKPCKSNFFPALGNTKTCPVRTTIPLGLLSASIHATALTIPKRARRVKHLALSSVDDGPESRQVAACVCRRGAAESTQLGIANKLTVYQVDFGYSRDNSGVCFPVPL